MKRLPILLLLVLLSTACVRAYTPESADPAPTAVPTPAGTPYTSSELGLSLVYPPGWIVDDGGDLLTIANSSNAIGSGVIDLGDAYVLILRDPTLNKLGLIGSDASTAGDLLDSLMRSGLASLNEALELDRQTDLSLDGFPAAAGRFSYGEANNRQINRIVVIVSPGMPTSLFFTATQANWETCIPLFDSILNSLRFDS